jgi:hypothetical protein
MTAHRPGRPDDRQAAGHRRPDPAVLDLIRRPYIAELLDALDQRPQTLTELVHRTHAPRRHAVAGLRALAAHRAITRTPQAGTWDATDDSHAIYQLTAAGHALIEYLFRLEVWLALFHPAPPPATQPGS